MNAYKSNSGQNIVYLDHSSSVVGTSTSQSSADPASLASIMLRTMILVHNIRLAGRVFSVLLPDEIAEKNPQDKHV